MNFIFVADFFVEHMLAKGVIGGGELNNEECIRLLISQKHSVSKVFCHHITPFFISSNRDSNFIIANFVKLDPACMEVFSQTNYVIYEHDHKYLRARNPALYENFKAPKEDIVNLEFYKNAKAVLCQSQFHMDIVRKNTNLTNIINLSGNLWNTSSLQLIEKLSKKHKYKKCSILDSREPHKNTQEAIKWCLANDMKYDLIRNPIYGEFLSALGSNEKFVFLPKTPETLSRVAIEARMMNMSLITNNMVGASMEPWFKLKGKELIDVVHEMRKSIPMKVVEAFK